MCVRRSAAERFVVMNFFEKELKKIAVAVPEIEDVRYVGRSCIGRLSEELRAKLEFITRGESEKYEALKVTVFNKNSGVIDSVNLRFVDVLVAPADRADGVPCFMYQISGERYSWYGFTPVVAGYHKIGEAVYSYLELFA